MKKAVIMGAGPAGLSCGYSLAKSGLNTVLFEADNQVGGISKTLQYKGYYFDLGGHRFFTKFEDVNKLWSEVLGDKFRKTPRLSRIYYNNRFFDYPLTPMNALLGVGLLDTAAILFSYIGSKLAPYPVEETFEQWVSNRFGKKLYSIFFKTYTEKVWGIPCSSIQAEWAAQRIKGLSLTSAIKNALIKPRNSSIKTLINEFDYPVLGPGMMYSAMKEKIEQLGGHVYVDSRVTTVNHEGYRIKSIEVTGADGSVQNFEGSDFISSIPVTELVRILKPAPEPYILEAAQKLAYRSLITIDIIINRKDVFPDNWIYIHSPEVKLGRIQNFKNWSRDMVPSPEKTSLGLEYFCTEHDDLWSMPDEELFRLAAAEVQKIRICSSGEIEDYTVVRVPKAYPVYSTGYKAHLAVIENYLKQFENLQPVGRYGLFKYNNMDHSILTGLYAAKNVLSGIYALDTWNVNTDEEYQEEYKEETQPKQKWKPANEMGQ